MAATTIVLDARVEFPANKVWQSDKGGSDYVSLKCKTLSGTSPNGKDPVVYANVGSPEQSTIAAYRKGDPVQLAYDGKKYSIVGSASTFTTANNTTPPPALEKPGIDIDKAQEYAKVYAAIFIKLTEKLPVTTPAEVVGTAASTVFIALTRN